MPLERLDHLLVLTDDLEATRSFYCDVLGLDVGERPPLSFAGYWLYLNGAPCLHLADRAEYERETRHVGLPAATTAAVDHVAFAGADYDTLRAQLERAGVDFVPNAPPGTSMRQLFLTDPNGVRVEVNVSSS
jgi:catechol 2,3-dioxygenase-like lactoylglutathione lyase family enzyme